MSRLLLSTLAAVMAFGQTLRHFTIADEIGQSQFGDPLSDDGDGQFSPNGAFFLVQTKRGRLDLNRPQDELRVYDSNAVRAFVNRKGEEKSPEPLWIIEKSTASTGPIIRTIRWLRDSSGFAFLVKTSADREQLYIAEMRNHVVRALTPEEQDVTAFDVRDPSHYVYTARDPAIFEQSERERNAPAFSGVGRGLSSILFPDDQYRARAVRRYDRSELWAARGDKSSRVVDSSSGRPILIYTAGQNALALSPAADVVATSLAVKNVPKEWEALYPTYAPAPAYRMTTGPQDTESFRGAVYVNIYATIDLERGRISELTNAPSGPSAKWVASWTTRAAWSDDGRQILWPGTFWAGGDPEQYKSGPCIAVTNKIADHEECVDRIKTFRDAGETILRMRFDHGTRDRVMVESRASDASKKTRVYVRSVEGTWRLGATSLPAPLDLSILQGLNEPPVLVARDPTSTRSRVLLDPNPQFEEIDLGEASVYRWKDRESRDWIGGLYKPPDYVHGRRYPLVIQTHGFSEHEFNTSGIFPTAFAARTLAAAGIMVLQVRDCPIHGTPDDGPCQVRGYESLIHQLDADGLIDPARVGIIGFSISCHYVLQALTTSSVHFKAATITDGTFRGYMQYLQNADFGNADLSRASDAAIGAQPFGGGLQEWLKRAPAFNLDKVAAPLQIVAEGRESVLFMWEAYAALWFQKKPVDLLVLNLDEHILTNPASRLVSQGGSVDWFRFWLQDYEDPDPGKTQQYRRWEELRKMTGVVAPNGGGVGGERPEFK